MEIFFILVSNKMSFNLTLNINTRYLALFLNGIYANLKSDVFTVNKLTFFNTFIM